MQLGDVCAGKNCPMGRAFILTKSAETPQEFDITTLCFCLISKTISSGEDEEKGMFCFHEHQPFHHRCDVYREGERTV